MLKSKGKAQVVSVIETIQKLEKVLIAMINGDAIGGGCVLAAACDLRVASEKTKLAIPSPRIDICISSKQIKTLVDLVGPSRP